MTTFKNLMKTGVVILLLLLPINLIYASAPNIVFILADDFGWTDWEMNGDSKGSTFYETPNLNQLAQEGMYFRQAYAHPLCSPTRVALMTGKYPGARIKMHQAITGGSVTNPILPASCGKNSKTCFPQNRNKLPLNEITIAEELKRMGYTTHHFGKWHLGNSTAYPKDQGFDSQFAVGGAGPGRGGYFAPYSGLSNIPQGPNGEYLTERLTNEVCKKIEQLKNDKFFIYFAHYNVHSPYQGKANLVKKYDKKAKPNNRHRHPTMGAMIESLDASVGKVMAKLNQLGLADNTIVIVMGDNGGVHWANDKNQAYKKIPITSNAPLQAGKACFYEGGVRVPLIVKYPSMVNAGEIENTPVHIIDFYPTLVELAQGSISPNKDVVDGVSILPLLSSTGSLAERPIFCHFPRSKQVGAPVGGTYVRKGNYKLCRLYGANANASDKYELYHIPNDPGEKNNIASANPKIVEDLQIEMFNWLEQTGAYVPHPNPNWKNADMPTANAGPNQKLNDADGNGSETVQLNGSGSSDLKGKITKYVWKLDGKQIAAGVKPNVTLSTGEHNIILTVTDNGGLTNFDVVTITIKGNTPPNNIKDITDLQANASNCSTIVLTWTDNSTGEDGFRIRRKPATGGQYSTIANINANTELFTDQSVGKNTQYVYMVHPLKNGVPAATSNIAIETTPKCSIGNKPPVANAGADQTLIDNDNNGSEIVILDGSGSYDSDGSITSYVWSIGNTQIATGVNPIVTLNTGVHSITLVVTDDKGDSNSNQVIITINKGNVSNSIVFIENKKSGHRIRPRSSEGNAICQAPATWTGNWMKWEIKNTTNGYFTLKNLGNKTFLSMPKKANQAIVISVKKQGIKEEWTKVIVEPNYFLLENRATSKRIKARSFDNYADKPKGDYYIEVSPLAWEDDWVRWKFVNAPKTATGNHLEAELLLEIYPNPADKQLHIQTNNNSKKHLQICNTNGQVVHESYIHELYKEIDISNLPNGIYIVVINNNSQVIHKQFIK
ncbi:MAG: sulfatase-like hydrolase/transferase [Bacteroidales bacterium]|nr:sulfatase-like hydrolase/transferase [Bacteroidales bacterium]